MWRQILVILALLPLLHCSGSPITCDPMATNPGCPNSRVCDPTGICQLTCTGNAQCTDPGTICDRSSTSPAPFPICQKTCESDGDCLTGQLCYTYTQSSGNSSEQSNAYKTCKQKCTLYVPCSGNTSFTCTEVNNATQSICYGAPASST